MEWGNDEPFAGMRKWEISSQKFSVVAVFEAGSEPFDG
jgi:hypothetical protein